MVTGESSLSGSKASFGAHREVVPRTPALAGTTRFVALAFFADTETGPKVNALFEPITCNRLNCFIDSFNGFMFRPVLLNCTRSASEQIPSCGGCQWI